MDVTSRIPELISMVKLCDRAILDVYNSSSFEVENKSDDSPLTAADKASNEIIIKTLTELFPDIPIISEEGDSGANTRTLSADRFWLVDPLDGTKEFVKKNDEFTICVALMENKKPIFGIISVPVKDTVYYGGQGVIAHKKVGDNEAQPIAVASSPTNKVSVSRSHLSERTKEYVNEHYPGAEMLAVGSSLKATLLAEGLVDVYPTFDSAGMSLWDLAASHAIIVAAGGIVTRPNGDDIIYDATDFKIGDFVARR